jgi:hypothetical protein
VVVDRGADAARLLEEAVTRPDVIAAAADMLVANYRPRPIIDAVNALIPMGRSGALAVLDAHLRHHDAGTPHDGLALLLRVLFEVPPTGTHAPLRLGGTVPPAPADPRVLPRYPIVLLNDVPLLLVTGYALGGDTEPVTASLRELRRRGAMRKVRLAPHGYTDAIRRRLRGIYRLAYGDEPTAALEDWVGRQLEDVAELLDERVGTSPASGDDVVTGA